MEDGDNNGHPLAIVGKLHDDEYWILRGCLSFYVHRDCQMIESNDPDLTEIQYGIPIICRISKPQHLAGLFIGNTNVQNATMMIGREFTVDGARALVDGIRGSNINDLIVWGYEAQREGETLPLDMAIMYLQPMEILQSLSLEFPLGDEHATMLGEALKTNRTLKSLELSVKQLTPVGAAAQTCGIQVSFIKELHLFGEETSLSSDWTEVMQVFYSQGISGSKIDTLCFIYVLGDVNALVKVVPTLNALIIDSIELNLADTQLLANALAQTTSIHSLRLCVCGLTNDHMRILSSCLGGNKSITDLWLPGNQIGDDGIVAFVEHWSLDSQIQALNVSYNILRSREAQSLVSAMSNRTAECELNLSYNKQIGYEGIKLIGQALGGKKVPKLDLEHVAGGWVYFDDEVCEAALNQMDQCHLAGQELLEGVRDNVFLTSVIVFRDNLPVRMVGEVEFWVKANRNGRHFLLLQQYILPPGFWCFVLAKQTANPSLMFLFLRELPSLMVGRGNAGRKRRNGS